VPDSTRDFFLSDSETKTLAHGKEFAGQLKKLPALILLNGVVGAGKTTWIKGFVSGYLKKKIVVTSPSYSLLNSYTDGKKEIIHGDFYRLQGLDDLESIGFWDFLNSKRVIIVEWGNLLTPQSWPADLQVYTINFEIKGETSRSLTCFFR